MTTLAYAAAASDVHFVKTSFSPTSRGNLWKRMNVQSRVAFVGGAAVRAEVEPGPIKTHTLKHDKGDEALPLLTAHKKALDPVLDDIWKTVTWREGKIRVGSGPGPFPDTGRKDYEFGRSLRN